MKNKLGENLKGDYKPMALSWIIFFASVMIPTILFSFMIGGSTIGALKASPIILLISSVISSEINLRLVTIDDDFMTSCGPLKIYRQRLPWEEIEGVRRNGDSPVEVMLKGKAIVFASNRSFKKKMTELMQQGEKEFANQHVDLTPDGAGHM